MKLEPTIAEIKKYVILNGGSFYKTVSIFTGEEAYCINNVDYKTRFLVSYYKLSLRMQENIFETKRY